MKINRNNYELYFVDYLDNNLSRGDLLEFMAFLAENPDLEEELNLVKNINLEPENISFNAKESLKKTNNIDITKERFEELCIGKIENTLTNEELLLLETQIKLHPELEKELKLFELTLVKPDLSVEFYSKDSLKHIEISTNDLFIGHIENELNEVQEKEFNILLKQSNEFKKEFELFNQTILKPDYSIVFPNKSSLKHRTLTPTKILFTRVIPAVAAVALLLIIAFNSGFFGKQNQTGKMFANSHKQNQLIHPKKQINSIENSSDNNFVATTNKQIQIKNNFQIHQTPDTFNNIAQNKAIVNPDTSSNKQNIIEQNNIINTNINLTASNAEKTNVNLDKTMEAVFANSKYEHFRDMIDNVPYASITAKNSGLASIGVWDVVEAGSKGLEYLTGKPVSVENKTDKKNHTKHFSFNIGKIGFSRTVHK